MFRSGKLLFAIVLLIATGLRMYNLDKGYNSDEGWLLKASQVEPRTLISYLGKGRSVYPPLSPFLLHQWRRVNNSEAWIRCYFVFFGTALCILVYFLGKLYLNERFGLIAFFFSSISPLLIWSSQFVRSYIDSAFWALLSTYFMLQLLTGKDRLRFSLAYIAASIAALYSSYLNGLIILSQSISALLTYYKEPKFLRKWAFFQGLVALGFTPGIALLYTQIKLATAINSQWSQRGFQVFGLNIGYHARSIAAIFGLDPDFLTTSSLTQKVNKIALFGLSLLALLFIVLTIVAALKKLRGLAKNARMAWFFPAISISALVFYNCLIEIMNFPAQTEYFVPQHALFLFVMSSLAYSSQKIHKANFAAIFLISLVFLSRFQSATAPEFETKNAFAYLMKNVKASDCILMARKTNLYIDPQAVSMVILREYLQKDNDADYYRPLNENAKAALSKMKETYNEVWFYRNYGNDEILGANKMIMDWLGDNGYAPEHVRKFKRIDILRYKKKD